MGIVFIIIAIIALFVFFAHQPTPLDKGADGEKTIAALIQKEIHRGLDGYILNNIYLPKKSGGTTEIDVLLISPKGLFVIESKNYMGYIIGDDQRKNWTVSLYAGKNWLGMTQTQKYRFYNPVWQNSGHIRALWNLIGTAYPVYSVIVFSDRGNLMNVRFRPEKATILKTSELSPFFSSIRTQLPDVLSAEDMQHIFNLLLPFTQVDEAGRQEHINRIHAPKAIPTFCPICGGTLVLRTSKQGVHAGQEFYGCSNYPKCHYTWSL